MPKRPKEVHTWRIYLVRAKGQFLGTVEAPGRESRDADGRRGVQAVSRAGGAAHSPEDRGTMSPAEMVPLEDRSKNGEWRVEYFDEDGGAMLSLRRACGTNVQLYKYHIKDSTIRSKSAGVTRAHKSNLTSKTRRTADAFNTFAN